MKSLLFHPILVFLAVLFPLLADTASSAVIYVDDTAAGANDGSSWTDAYTDLQNALTAANPNDQIWVAAGTYYPSIQIGGTGSRYATFQMKNDVAIYGGFAGTGTDPNQRDIQNNQTILSGDIGTAGSTSDNCYHIFYHPTGLNLNATAILDGFTITAANAYGPSNSIHRYGGGMYNNSSSPTVRNCTFSNNWVYFDGSGIYNSGSNPILFQCIFSNNTAYYNGGAIANEQSSPSISQCTFSGNLGYKGGAIANEQSSPAITQCSFTANTGENLGGAIYNISSSNPATKQCSFAGNTAPYGGAIFSDTSHPCIINCVFINNRGGNSGGAISNHTSSHSTITNCTFAGNSAYNYGGAIRCFNSSNPTITHCTLTGNIAKNGGGIANSSSSPTVTNCILWGNRAATQGPQIDNSSSSPTVTYCDIEGGWTGDGNLDSDPLFTDPNGLDGTLGTADDDLRLSYLSPCRDKGSNALLPPDTADLNANGNTSEPLPYDLYDQPRIIDGDCSGTATVDMGALEFNGKLPGDIAGLCDVGMEDLAFLADNWLSIWRMEPDIVDDSIVNLMDLSVISRNWMQTGCGDCNGADITGDGNVDIDDISVFADQWLFQEQPDCQQADIDSSGTVDLADLSILAANWMMGV